MELFDRMPTLEAEAGRPKDERRPFTPIPISGFQVGWGLTHAAHLVEVEVDTDTGVVRPGWAGAAVAAGRIHAHRQARSQVESGVVHGLSYALHEEWVVDPATGIVISSDLDSYRIAGIADVPDIEVHFVEDGFEGAAGGGAGLSELSTVGVAAALGNAVAAATGARRTALPVRPGPEAAL